MFQMHCKNIWEKKQSDCSTTYILESDGSNDWLEEKHEKSRISGKKKNG